MDTIRHGRRRLARTGASALAIVAAGGVIAGCAATTPRALAGRSGAPAGPPRNGAHARTPTGQSAPRGNAATARRIVTPEPVASPPQPIAATGTVLTGCATQASQGGLGRDWQASPDTTRAGPLAFVGGGHSRGPLRLYVAVAVLTTLRPGSVVVVRVARAERAELRFLYGPADSLNPGARHTMASGESGVSFVACPGDGAAPGITDYYGGFLIRGARCVPVRAWIPGRASPIAFRLGACPGR